MQMERPDFMFCLPVISSFPARAAEKYAAKTPVKIQKVFPGIGSGYLLAERIAKADFKASA